MIKSIDELKEFILWAKDQKLRSVKLGDTQFEFSDLAHIEGLQGVGEAPKDLSVPASSTRLPDWNVQANEEEEELFWSVI